MDGLNLIFIFLRIKKSSYFVFCQKNFINIMSCRYRVVSLLFFEILENNYLFKYSKYKMKKEYAQVLFNHISNYYFYPKSVFNLSVSEKSDTTA